ncbi:MAG: NAD(P)-binding domain-containing protein [Anaerolineae bacterium]|nr:NAD(P)-binding domain-containing protein [Anaerolineae bacterium]
MTMIYNENDGEIAHLSGKTVGVIGYSVMGQAFALNMRDSGVDVVISVHSTAESEVAEGHQIPIAAAAEVVRRAQVIVMALPDEAMGDIYIESVSPNLKRGHTLIFTSAYNVTFGYIEPPPFVDVGLVSPRMTGVSVRGRYVTGEGTQSFVAVGQDASREAWQTVLAVARAIGALKAGAVEIHFEQEAQLSLFIQQAIIPAFHHMMVTAASLLMRSGYPAEAALPDLYLSGKFYDYLEQTREHGLLHAIEQSSLTGQYSTLSRLPRYRELKMERLMEVTLEEIRKGDFAREWSREYGDGCPRLTRMVKAQEAIDMWDWEQQTIEMLGGEVRG